jgi:predicted metalloprotease
MFNDNSRLDTSQVEDRRGSGGGGLGGMGAIGGVGVGLGFIAILVISLLTGFNPSNLVSNSTDAPSDNTAISQSCATGADANTKDDCRVVGFVNSIQQYWTGEFSARGKTYQPAKTTLFSDATQTGCGTASSQTGPFYCPNDGHVYLDLSFFNELQTRFGAKGGPFAVGYVLAHEYGHHVQDMRGLLDKIGRDTGPNSTAVRSELQADCLAGVWAHNATQTGFIAAVSDAEIGDALSAASAVGDDHIQKQSGGKVNPETWTHGSSEQRQQWFTTGYRGGRMEDCDPLLALAR